MTIDTKTSTTPDKGEAAVRHLWRQAIDDGDEAKAKTIAVVANLLQPSIKLAAGAAVPAKTADATVTVDGAEVDLTGLEDADARDYAEYVAELDGTARLQRHVERLEWEDEEIVRVALEEAERLHSEADEKLEHYDEIVHEATRLRAEIFGLRRDRDELPDRINRARLDSLVPDSHGEDPDLLERRYVAASERLPVAERRLARLEADVSRIASAGSRPAQVSAEGGRRRPVKHEARTPILDGLTEVIQSLERLRESLPDAVKDATAPLIKERDTLRDGQNQLWGLAKARR